MAQRTVTFKRTEGGELIVSNLWIRPHEQPREKLEFNNNNEAKYDLDEGLPHRLTWTMLGPVDAELKVERKIGPDGDLADLVKSSKIPARPGVPPGQPRGHRGAKTFTI
jgi:hypothetical protein